MEIAKSITDLVTSGKIPTWLGLIELFFSQRVGHCLWTSLKIGVNVGLLYSSARGYPICTAFLFILCYTLE